MAEPKETYTSTSIVLVLVIVFISMTSAAIVADDSIVKGPSALEQFEKRDDYLRKFHDDPERFRNEAEKVWGFRP